ncbi:MAG: hypothetical protein AABP62_25305 [Planctomycetota bacterium]
MNEPLPVSRRQALVAVSTATAIGAIASVTSADDKPGDKNSGDALKRTPPLKLKVTLTDGQIVTLNAKELVIDFGTNGQLLVMPNGFLPVRENGKESQSDKRPNSGSQR